MNGHQLITEDEIRNILSLYELGQFVSLEHFSTGTVQENILIHTGSGKLVLKHYRNRTVEYVAFETKLIEYLKTKNFCCPIVYSSQVGELYVTYHGRAIVLHEFIAGEHRDTYSEHEFDQLIAKIAQLHRHTTDLLIDGWEHRWNYGVEFCKNYLDHHLECNGQENLLKKRAWLKDELSVIQLSTNLNKGIIHGDLDNSNIYFHDEELVAIIDFDDSNFSYFLFDLLGLVNGQCQTFLDENYFETFKNVISEYEKVRCLDQLEKESLFDVIRLSIIIDCFWFFDRGEYPHFFEKQKMQKLKTLGGAIFFQKVFG